MERRLLRSSFRRVTAFATTLFLTAATMSLPAMAKSKTDSLSTRPLELESAPPKLPVNKNKEQWVTSSVLIQAPLDQVWRTIHEERLKDPDLAYSKVIEQTSPTECKLEQKFNFLPVIGSSVCLMSNKEVPNQRIDYALLHSDRFKAMEGSWELTPCEDGQATRLQLSSHLDLGIPVPRSFMNSVTSKKMQKRLDNIKLMAENAHSSQVAAAKNHLPQ